MSDIYITLNNEVASIAKADKISSGDVDTVYVHFTFSEDWDSFPVKTVCVHTITLNEDKIGTNFVGINSEGVAVVPQKALSQAGKLFIAVVGENTNGEVLTSTWATLRIVFGADFEVEDDESDVLGRLVPAGGNRGDFLCKKSDDDFDYTWGMPELMLDTEMSDTSENGVQNKVIKTYVDSMAGDYDGKFMIPYMINVHDNESYVVLSNEDRQKLYNMVDTETYANRKLEFRVTYFDAYGTAIITEAECPVLDIVAYTENVFDIDMTSMSFKFSFFIDNKEYQVYAEGFKIPITSGTHYDTTTLPSITITEVQPKLTAGNNISINGNVISATSTSYTEGNGIDISNNEISVDTTVIQEKLTAGSNISINNNVISASETSYTAGNGIDITNNEISVNTTEVQEKLTAGANVSISNGVISATDTTYSAGTNVSINSSNEISATDTTYTAGAGLSLSNGEFSVDETVIQPKLTVGDSISIDANNEITANYINPKYTYDEDTHTYTCDMSASDINTAVMAGKIIIPFVEYISISQNIVWSNTNGASSYRIENGPNNMKTIYYWLNMFGGTNNDSKYEFRFAHILGQNVIAGTLYIQEYQEKLTAGSNVSIDANTNTISATDTTYSAGSGLSLSNGEFSVDTTTIQPKLTAGTNITIDANNVISASGGSSPYIEGTGIDIDSSTNEISVDTTVIQEKLTAGSNISISSNTISADIVEPLVTFTMTPTGLTPAYSVSCDTAFSDITTLVNSNKFKAVLNITTSGTMARYIPLTEYKYGGGTTYNFYFSYAEGDTLTTYVISKDYTQQTDVYTYTIEVGVLTDTTYSAGTNVSITNGVISATDTTYTAGTNVSINNGVISATDTTYTAGTGISITNGVISLDLAQAENNSF